MANIVRCRKCGGKVFVPDIGQPMPLRKAVGGTTFISITGDSSCTCK